MEHATKSCRRPPKCEKRVHFADSIGMDLVSIFLIDFLKLIHQNLQTHHQPQLQYQKQQYQLQKQKQLELEQQQHHQQQQQHHHHLQQQQNNKPSSLSLHTQQQQTPQQQLPQQTNHQHHYHYHYPQIVPAKPSLRQPSQQQNNNNNRTTQTIQHPLSQQTQSHQQPQQLQSQQLLPQQTAQQPATICQFTQPISLISFKERVRLNKVHLETCQVESRSAGLISVKCTVKVLNLAYEKSVVVRYTCDEWYSHKDVVATYQPGSNDGEMDRFLCDFSAPLKGKRMMIAIQYNYEGTTCWDNNGGYNYTIQILN